MNPAIITCQRFHGRQPGTMGSSVIRGDWLVKNWPELRAWKTGMVADAMIFQKVYWSYFMKDFPGRKVLDMCDPDWKSGEMKLIETANLVDAITCSNDNLTRAVAEVVKDRPVITIPDRLDLSLFTGRKQHYVKAKRVVWFGYHHNAIETLPQVLQSLGRRGLELLVVSNSPFSPTATYGCMIQNIRWDQSNAYQAIQSADIAINPALLKSNFRFKSNNKTVIAWALGLPVANTNEDIDRFIDPVERTKEAEARWLEVKRDYDIKLSVEQYKKLLYP